MISHDLNLNLLRVFESVYRTGSMTEAAKELHLTQSGVSQHITALEEVLEVKVFDRIKQRLLPTERGRMLYLQTSESLNQIENVIFDVKGQERAFSGVVNIGMPIEFGNSIVMPIIADFSKKYPKVTFNFNLGYATTMNDLLVRGELDFAIIDEFKMDRSITTQKVFDEILELCIAEDLLKEKVAPKNNIKYYETLDFVEYQAGNPVLNMWFKHHLGKSHPNLNVRAYIMDVQGIARLIVNKVGVGVLPSHVVEKMKTQGDLIQTFRGCGKPLKNSIGIAKLTQRSLSRAASAAYDWTLVELKKFSGDQKAKDKIFDLSSQTSVIN
jgi:DNA-binding transcriptional LysR family regulator